MQWFYLLTLGTIWGASYLFIKVGGAEITPFTFVAGRVTIAALAVGGLLLAGRKGLPPWRRDVWGPLFVLGVCNGLIPYTLITWGETQISSGLAGILVATMPIFTVILAHYLTHDEKFNINKLAGIALGFIGVVILFIPGLQRGVTLSLVGSLATVAAAISYAFATIFVHKNLRNIPNLSIEFGQLASASIMLVPASLVIEHPWTLKPSLAAIVSLVTLALLGTAFAYLLYFWLIEHAGPTSTSLVTHISPVSAVLLGAIVLHETFDWTAFLGFAGIVAGVVLVSRTAAQTEEPPVAMEAG